MDTEFHELGRIFVPTGIDRHGDSLYVLTNTTVLSGKPETFYRLCGIPLADSGEMMR